jgi:hypothetical protein
MLPLRGEEGQRDATSPACPPSRSEALRRRVRGRRTLDLPAFVTVVGIVLITAAMTPLMPYFPLVLAFCRRYATGFGVGSLMALSGRRGSSRRGTRPPPAR